MAQKNEAGRTFIHLAAIGLVGGALLALELQAGLIALFAGGGGAVALVVGVQTCLGVALFAGLGTAARPLVPSTRSAGGLWAWAAGAYVSGTAGAFCLVWVNHRVNDLENVIALFPAVAACYALAAAFFLPGARRRLTTLAATAVFIVGGGCVTWAATRPPTVDQWIADNRVDRDLLRLGDAPPGYTLTGVGAGTSTFGANYERSPSAHLHLEVRRISYVTERTDTSGCPVPRGTPIHCSDDGAGRQSVTYEGWEAGEEHQELRLRSRGLVYIVSPLGTAGDLPAARHILSTLRPATHAELRSLVDLPSA
jgi:hypothetical protein